MVLLVLVLVRVQKHQVPTCTSEGSEPELEPLLDGAVVRRAMPCQSGHSFFCSALLRVLQERL